MVSKGPFYKLTMIGQKLTVESQQYLRRNRVEFRFALTNFSFLGTERYTLDQGYTGLQLPFSISPFRIVVRPIKDYKSRIHEIRATRRPNVTCQIIVKDVSAEQEQDILNLVNDLCLLLTLSRGCRVDWPYYDVFLSDGEKAKSYHRNAIIKPFSSLSLIPEMPPEDIKRFVESSYRVLSKKKEAWKFRKAVDAYTDGKIETDFLDARGLKMVITMELLKSRYLEHISKPAKVNILDTNVFNESRTQLVDGCEKLLQGIFPDIAKNEIEMMANHAQGFNYYPFGRSLAEICESLGLQFNSLKRRRFVEIRNELVHRFSLLDESDRNGSRWEQYMFLMTFVGQILLAIIEFEGYYYDRTKPPGSEGNSEMRVKLNLV